MTILMQVKGSQPFDVGEAPDFVFTFVGKDGVRFDPTVKQLKAKKPDGTTTTYTSFTREELGVWFTSPTLDQSGVWKMRVIGDAAVQQFQIVVEADVTA